MKIILHKKTMWLRYIVVGCILTVMHSAAVDRTSRHRRNIPGYNPWMFPFNYMNNYLHNFNPYVPPLPTFDYNSIVNDPNARRINFESLAPGTTREFNDGNSRGVAFRSQDGRSSGFSFRSGGGGNGVFMSSSSTNGGGGMHSSFASSIGGTGSGTSFISSSSNGKPGKVVFSSNGR